MVCGRFSRKPIWQRGFHGRTRVTRWKINESEVLITENDPFFRVNMGGVPLFLFFLWNPIPGEVCIYGVWVAANDRRPSGRVPCHLWCWQYWHAALCVPRWIFCCGLEKVEENQLTSGFEWILSLKYLKYVLSWTPMDFGMGWNIRMLPRIDLFQRGWNHPFWCFHV